MASIGLEHVSKHFGGVEAVRDMSIEVADGEFLVIVGPSGCGKTTVLRLIAGLELPDSGSVLIDGRVVNDVPARERDVAMVFEDFALYPNMAVRDNLSFPLRMRRTPAEAIRQRVSEVAASMEIDDILGRKPGSLAAGQAQHVAVGHAVMRQRTAVFLLDDALSHLDAHQRLEARAELSRLHRELGATIVGVTHDQAEALAVGTRIAVMDEGRLAQAGTPRELYERPATTFVASFIGSPPMNLLEMTAEREDGVVRLRHAGSVWQLSPSAALDALADGSVTVVGFRPEDVRLGGEPRATDMHTVATCDLTQYLGHRRLVHLHCGTDEIVASVEPGHDPRVGEDIGCAVPVERLRFFEPSTGRAMSA